ncbi:MAG TPA: DUF1080 domain-containing protein [Verrucomicrobiae bacterium]|jgi:hypothetical protein|nr:DUF1080 domain-containing protein [Verrucomicrobiae bacterium]
MINRLIFSIATLAAVAGATAFAAEQHGLGYSDTPLVPGTKWHIHDGDRPQPRIVTPGEKFSQMATAPSDAVVLFDGKDFSKWKGEKGDVKWKIEDGYMETTRTGRIRTKDEFGDFQMHLEFATPEKITGNDGKPLKGQARGNNGVNIFGKYEIQVLDSYDNPTYPDGQAAAIYGQTPPLVNASRPPGQWQTYDVVFEAPHWNESGEMTRKGYITLLHNGVIVQNKRELLGGTNHRQIVPFKPDAGKGFIELYEHGNPVRFRNIWIRPLGEIDNPNPDWAATK